MHSPADKTNPSIPPGWSYNPSAWSDRLPLVGAALLGFLIAAYLALYQWNVFPKVWDPVFGSTSSSRVLHSSISKLLPIPDAALGAMGYLLDAAAGLIGGRARWRSMPWIVLLFGAAVAILAAASIVLLLLQPLYYHAWCFLCLCSAAISITLVVPAMDEVLAAIQFLKRHWRQGRSLWQLFWGRDSACHERSAPHVL